MHSYDIGLYIGRLSYYRIYYSLIKSLLQSELSTLIVYDDPALYHLSVSHFSQNSNCSFRLVSAYSDIKYPLSLCSVYVHEGLTIYPSLFNYIHRHGVRVVSSCLHFLDGILKPPSQLNCFDSFLLPSPKISDYHEEIVRKTFSGSSLYSELKSLDHCREISSYVGSPIFDNAHLCSLSQVTSTPSCLSSHSRNCSIGKISTCQLSSKPYLLKLFASLATFNFGLLTRINSQYSIIYQLFLMLALTVFPYLLKQETSITTIFLFANVCRLASMLYLILIMTLTAILCSQALLSNIASIASRSFAAIQSTLIPIL